MQAGVYDIIMDDGREKESDDKRPERAFGTFESERLFSILTAPKTLSGVFSRLLSIWTRPYDVIHRCLHDSYTILMSLRIVIQICHAWIGT